MGTSSDPDQAAKDDVQALVLIETASNQAYVFASNRLREAVGASELIYRAGAQWVWKVCRNEEMPDTLEEIFEILTDDTKNPRPCKQGNRYQILLVTSGKALIRCINREAARDLIAKVTERSLQCAAGLSLFGSIEDLPRETRDSAERFAKAVGAVHHRYEEIRGRLPAGFQPMPRLPVAADCAATGKAASGFDPNDPARRDLPKGRAHPYSEESIRKRNVIEDAYKRLQRVLTIKNCAIPFNKHYMDPEIGDGGERAQEPEGDDWIAVIHADGNGLGQAFLNLHESLRDYKQRDADAYAVRYRAFSEAVETATRTAICKSVRETFNAELNSGKAALLKPLVIAGDDVTLLCPGDRALLLVKTFLEAFERESAESEVIKDVVNQINMDRGAENRLIFPSENGGLTAGAGIAIVKAHHPFHRAYELAEQLAKSAKKLKQQGSAFDFHLSFDGVSDLDLIEEKQKAGNLNLRGGPYLLKEMENRTESSVPDLEKGMSALSETDKEMRLPKSQQQELRAAFLRGKSAAEATARRIRHRYPHWSGWPLFFDKDALEPRSPTLFLDAYDLVDLGNRP